MVEHLEPNRANRRAQLSADRRGVEVILPDGCSPALTQAQAAAYTGLAEATLETLRSRGGGPRFVKLSRNLIRYRLHDLDAFLDARTVASTSEKVAA